MRQAAGKRPDAKARHDSNRRSDCASCSSAIEQENLDKGDNLHGTKCRRKPSSSARLGME
jgi:hypothetical protein